MPKIEKHAPGAFCWVELGTTDQTAAKSFYASVFGWTPVDFPMGPDQYYTMFKLNGGDAAAAYSMRPEERAMIPPHWNPYICVASADESAKLVGELGGKVIEGPFDVMTFGRMAVIQDPVGAFFNIWEPKDHPGITVTVESGTLTWADLRSPDPSRAKEFYEALFGWKIGPAEHYPPNYLVVQNHGQPIAGLAPPSNRNPNVPPHWMLFFLSSDVDGMAAKAQSAGGAVHVAPMSMGGARFSVLADPQGAAFSIIHPPQRG